ncbi:MAG: hypothetical protein K8U03_06205 [Planctomycetia bacterium]|nr:hypothetical protein [Planctomycetia bacterium]
MPRGSQAERSATVPTASLPPGAPAWVTTELLANTIAVWQPYYSEPLSDQTALDLVLGVGRLFAALGDVDEDAQEVPRPRTGQ